MSRSKNKVEKQNADRHAPKTERDGFTAEEIGEQALYENGTETSQRMRRGLETEGDADARDYVGGTASDEVSPDVSADKAGADDKARRPKKDVIVEKA